jgi:hypothetical protein
MQNHPARRRHYVEAWAMIFGVLGAPAAWVAHLVVNFALASEACSPGAIHLEAGAISSLRSTMLGNNAAALIVAALATWTSYRNWHATHDEEGGNHEHLLEIGEGRTRFLSMVGMVLGGGFFAATLFDTLALLVVPLCG